MKDLPESKAYADVTEYGADEVRSTSRLNEMDSLISAMSKHLSVISRQVDLMHDQIHGGAEPTEEDQASPVGMIGHLRDAVMTAARIETRLRDLVDEAPRLKQVG